MNDVVCSEGRAYKYRNFFLQFRFLEHRIKKDINYVLKDLKTLQI